MKLLERYEKDITEAGLGYVKAAKAVWAIKEGDLWAESYNSWEDYYVSRWGWKKSHIDRLLKTGSFLLDLESSPAGELPPPTERIAREVLRVKVFEDVNGRWVVDEVATSQKRVDVWEQVATQINGETTSEDVRQLVDRSTGRGMSGGPSQEKQDKATRAKIWNAIQTLAEAGMTPKQLIAGKAYGGSDFPNGRKALKYLTKLNDLLA